MRKIFWLILLMLFVTNCAYNPVVDTAGRSGTFQESKAVEITNDKQHCKTVAKENSDLISNVTYWLLDPNSNTKYESIYRKCLANRGHSVLN